jgi:hypothetical protein
MAEKKKSRAALALAARSREVRMKTMTKAERSAQGRRAVSMRRDRRKGPWYGLLLFPEDYEWHGVAHATKVLDELHANPTVVFWSTDRAEVVKRAAQKDLRDLVTDVVEQNWDPRSFVVRRTFAPDTEAMKRLLKVDLEGQV